MLGRGLGDCRTGRIRFSAVEFLAGAVLSLIPGKAPPTVKEEEVPTSTPLSCCVQLRPIPRLQEIPGGHAFLYPRTLTLKANAPSESYSLNHAIRSPLLRPLALSIPYALPFGS